MAYNPRQILPFDFTGSLPFKLLLEDFRKVSGASKKHEPRRIRIQPMSRPGTLRAIQFAHQELQGIAIESATRMHRQGSRLVDDDDRFVLIENQDISIDVRLDCRR